jgi:hypothetical protein
MRAPLFIFLSLPFAAAAALAAPWGTVVIGSQSPMERLATADLARYLGQVTDTAVKVVSRGNWEKAPVPSLHVELDETVPGEDYRITAGPRSGVYAVTVAGGTPQGVVNGVYGLLRALGCRFYLGSESVPAALPEEMPGPLPIVGSPVFSVRGVLPWYNFFNSPTAWDPIDHRAFADQLIRSGANFLTFHTYDAEPFAAYEENGKTMEGAPLLNTASPTWGTSGTGVDQFAFGTDKLYSDAYFGAASTMEGRGTDDAVRLEKAILRDGLIYACKRGLKVGLGFEITGDPTQPEVCERFLRRFNAVLDYYPFLDYVFLWQAETQGAQGFAEQYNQHILPVTASPESLLQFYGMERRPVFKRVVERGDGARPFFQDNEAGRRARANEGARLEQFSWLALRALSRREEAPKLVISGWGGEDRLLSAEYYAGLDKILPKDVVFSSLDFISARPRVDSVYHALPADRQRWPIPWLECDGDQWHPQAAVGVYDKMMRDILQGGSQGVLGIHWRTRDVEEAFGFVTAFAWNPSLTAGAFFQDLALHGYGPASAAAMSDIHRELDALGYRWVGGGGQNECAPFSWGPGEPQKAEQLRALRVRAAAVSPETRQGRERLAWLIAAMDWTLAYYDAELAAVKAGELVAKAKSAPDAGQAGQAAAEARELLGSGLLAKAMRAYAARITTRGEYGVLATVNTKAAADWRRLWNAAGKVLGVPESDPPAPVWTPEAAVILPRLVTSVPEGVDLVVDSCALGGGDTWAHYRGFGAKEWTTIRCATVRGWVKRATIPGAAVHGAGILLRLSLSPDPTREQGAIDRAVTIMAEVTALSPSTVRKKLDEAAVGKGFGLRMSGGYAAAVKLMWDKMPEADFFRVLRNGQPAGNTGVNYAADIPMQLETEYRVEAVRDGRVIDQSQPAKFTMPDKPVTETVTPRAFANRGGITVEWDGAATYTVASYRVSRAPEGRADFAEAGTVRAARSGGQTFHDTPGDGKWTYRVTPLNVAGREGVPGEVTVAFPAPVVAPAIQWPLTAAPEGASLQGAVAFTPEGARFDDGRIVAENRAEAMDLNHAFTLDFTFRADRVDGMPVLLCHGAWQVDGWFVQILGGQLIVRTPGGDAQGPAIEEGKWYACRFVFDGARLRLAINGEWVFQGSTAVRNVPAARPLVLGNYCDASLQYQFHGLLRDVMLTQDALLDAPAKP